MPVRIQTKDFDAGAEMAALRLNNPKIGAVASFIGVCRDANDGTAVTKMTLEHYPGMTEKALEQIVSEAKRRWGVTDVLVVHRVGELKPGDNIVLVVTASAHREAAFSAAEFLMDYLKMRAPFWKKETRADGVTHWVDARASDEEVAGRWEEPPKTTS